MISKQEIIDHALSLGFADIGFTSAESFEKQREILHAVKDDYQWIYNLGITLEEGIDPRQIYPQAKSIIVLLDIYFQGMIPPMLKMNFGRVYLDDDRMTKDGLSRKIKAFRSFLRDNGIDSKVPPNLPQRVAAARAGVGNFGKNCLLYATRVAARSSWVVPIPIIIDHEFPVDSPSFAVGCPTWCHNACVIACPTGALKGNQKIDPRKCISYLSYFGEGLTPRELREPMGLWVYGCDHCQDVCPRNQAWIARTQEQPTNPRIANKTETFNLHKLLLMDRKYFEREIWPHMFYSSDRDLWRWKMNVARVMGNSLDPKFVPDLIQTFKENNDERVKCMCAWALGRIGHPDAIKALNELKNQASDKIREEIEFALASNSVK